jgi:alcohol dehydrogenase class IV
MTRVEMEAELKEITDKNLLLVLSESSAIRWELHDLIESIESKNRLIWIRTVKTNPSQDDILRGCNVIGNDRIDLIVAIGGGSSLDLAKGISAFYEYGQAEYSIEEITKGLKDKSYTKKKGFIDILAIPTTAGTGSELTQWATIWDRDMNVKYSIDHPGLKPKKALIVPELTLTLSKNQTLATGLDALSHGIEAYWSRHTNPLVQDLAFRGIQLIVENLARVLEEPGNLDLREGMCRASLLTGLAFSQTRTTACHSISYPMTMLYNIPHGYAVAMTLGGVAEKNRGMFAKDSNLYELFKSYGGIQAWLDKVSKGVTSLRLSGFGISRQDIDRLVSNSFTAGRMDNNPVQLSEEDVKEILMNIY